MYHTLFPDYLTLEEGRDRLEAQRLIEALCQVRLEVMQTNMERAAVLRRLGEEGVESVYHLLNVQRNEVAEWRNVGQVFLHIMDEMREEVKRNPEAILNRWRNELAPIVFPEESGAGKDHTLPYHIEPQPVEEVRDSADSEREAVDIRVVEQTFVDVIDVLEHRWPIGGEILRRYFLENQSVKMIVHIMDLSSPAVLHRLVNHRFLRSLCNGESLFKLSLSHGFCRKMKDLRKQLLYRPARLLDALQRMSPERFLSLFDLTLLSRTLADRIWAGDIIVAHGEVQHTRRVLHALLAELQLRPGFSSGKAIRRALGEYGRGSVFKGLLNHHPWIEHSDQGHRLMSQQLCFDFCRIGRILCDSPEAMTGREVMIVYERRYLERPKRISLGLVKRYYPQIVVVKRGVWQWQ